jgi:hypothetical protein
MIVPKQLISLLNSGRCIAIIGSGPSCDMGYPSWRELAEKCLSHAREEKFQLDEGQITRLMNKADYPSVFRYLQKSMTRSTLVSFIVSKLIATQQDGKAYQLLSQWPFRFYMTTNWDSEIQDHLRKIGHHFTEVSNTHAEITQITDETSKQVVKLHGLLSEINSLVLTEDDYQEFKVGDQRRYFRETLKSILRTLPSVVIGHSLADPDIQTILEAAKTIAPTHRPVYMIVGDPQQEDIDTYFTRYNIHLIGYKKDPTYTNFFKLLSHIDKFIVPRAGGVVRTLDPPQQREIEVATSLLVFNSLSKSLDSPHLLDRFVYPQLLQALKRSANPLHPAEFASTLFPDALRTLPSIMERIDAGLSRLSTESLIIGSDSEGWKLTPAGDEVVLAATNTQRFEDDQVYGSLIGCLKTAGISSNDCDKAAQSLKIAILSVFRKRGLAAASLIFRGQKFEPIDMAELFESVTASIQWADSFELREMFIDFAVRLLSSPTNEERRYLARVSQGLFAVHVFGMDPIAVDSRLQVFKSVSWFLDSNVLIHLLATGATLNDMAKGICEKCKRLGIRLYASQGVVQESINSLEWASKMCQTLSPHEEMQFIYQVYNEDGYRPNPYIDGFVNSHQSMAFSRFSDYRKHIGITDYESVTNRLAEAGILVVGLQSLPEDNPRRRDFTKYKNQILVERERRRTSRGGEFQADVEAEVLCLILAERDQNKEPDTSLQSSYFVSTSRLLDHMFGSSHGTLTWYPDVFFKHLSLIAPSNGDTESLIESMGTELAELGITLVDQDAYRTYFDPLISSSRMSFEQERTKFVEALHDETGASADDLQREFDATPDIGKPLFVAQMYWRIGNKGVARLERQLGEASRRQEELAAKLKTSENEWQEKQKATVQHYENRIRNLSDPARREKLKRKARNKNKRRKK